MLHDEAHRHLNAKDARLAAHIAQARRHELLPQRGVRPFDALAESIAYQQLSGKAAATIWKRVRALFPKRKFLDPAEVLAMSDEKLRAAGLSRSKIAGLKDLAAKTIEGIVPTSRQLAKMSDQQIIERLMQVRGIGCWTVEMLLLFDLARPDVWPVHDYGVRKGFAKIFRKRKLPTPKELDALGKRFAPYRSALAWYCWRALDKPEPSGNRS